MKTTISDQEKIDRKARAEALAHGIAKKLGLEKAFAAPVHQTHWRHISLEWVGDDTSWNRSWDECAKLGRAIQAELEADQECLDVADWGKHHVNVWLN